MNRADRDDDERLLAECEVEAKTAGGPGGQRQNRKKTAVRLRHGPSGIVVVARARRSHGQNLAAALARLRERLEARARVRKPRVPRKPSAEERRHRVEAKRLRGARKRERRALDEETGAS